MNDADVLDEIRRLARRRCVRFTRHARDRMDERGAEPEDVLHALIGATSASYQSDRDSWRVAGGCDCDGDDLTVVVVLEADVVVVTIF